MALVCVYEYVFVHRCWYIYICVNTSLYRELSCAVVSLLGCFVVVYIACESATYRIKGALSHTAAIAV